MKAYIFEADDTPRASPSAHFHKVRNVPDAWIDSMGLPTHGMGEITEFLTRERALLIQSTSRTSRVLLHFCYFYRGSAYAATAELIPWEGLVVAVTATHMLARMTADEMTYTHLHLLAGKAPSESIPKKERFRLVSDGVTEKPRWALAEISEFKVTPFDYLKPTREELFDCGTEQSYVKRIDPRPATIQGVIQEISRALKPNERTGALGRLRMVRRIRTVLGEQGRESSMESLVAMATPITAEDAVFYDECRDLAHDALNDERSFWELVGKLGLYAHTRLPTVYSDRFMERWTTEVMVHQPSLEDIQRIPPHRKDMP